MGPYCEFCNHRCFVVRQIPFKTEQLLLATCLEGRAHDREVTGYDADTAINPVTPVALPVAAAGVAELRDLAVALESEVSLVIDRAARAVATLSHACTCRPAAPSGSLDDLLDETCSVCEAVAILTGHRDPAPAAAA